MASTDKTPPDVDALVQAARFGPNHNEALNELVVEVERLREVLRDINDNAMSWHAGEDGKAKALAVIARWSRAALEEVE